MLYLFSLFLNPHLLQCYLLLPHFTDTKYLLSHLRYPPNEANRLSSSIVDRSSINTGFAPMTQLKLNIEGLYPDYSLVITLFSIISISDYMQVLFHNLCKYAKYLLNYICSISAILYGKLFYYPHVLVFAPITYYFP